MSVDESKNPWTTKKSKEVYNNPWIKVTEHEVLNPKGGDGIYGVVHFKHLAIGILPIDKDGNIYLIGQYRYPLKEYSWEIPEGGGVLDQDPLDSAKRELQEECGLLAKEWEIILEMHLSNSVSDEKAIIYLAQDLKQVNAEPEDTEELAIKKLPLEEAYQMVCDGKITDSISVAGILKLKLLLSK